MASFNMDANTPPQHDTDAGSGTDTDASTNTNTDNNSDKTTPSPLRKSIYHRCPALMQKIWERVIPPHRPGVHIFALENPESNSFNPYLPRWTPLSAPILPPDDGGYGWFFRHTNSVPSSWHAHNPSTYLIDSGLWNACKQSRAVMRKVYQVAEWQEFGDLYPHVVNDELTRQALTDLPVTAHFRDRGQSRYFSLYPNKDLFYFQPAVQGLQNAPWGYLMPLGRHLWTILMLPNIALELNPA